MRWEECFHISHRVETPTGRLVDLGVQIIWE
jgi:hypothetical protein